MKKENFRDKMCKMFKNTTELRIANEKAKDRMKVDDELETADKNVTRVLHQLRIKEWLKGGKF